MSRSITNTVLENDVTGSCSLFRFSEGYPYAVHGPPGWVVLLLRASSPFVLTLVLVFFLVSEVVSFLA